MALREIVSSYGSCFQALLLPQLEEKPSGRWGNAFQRHLQPAGAISGVVHRVAFFFQALLDEVGHLLLVFNNQKPHAGVPNQGAQPDSQRQQAVAPTTAWDYMLFANKGGRTRHPIRRHGASRR